MHSPGIIHGSKNSTVIRSMELRKNPSYSITEAVMSMFFSMLPGVRIVINMTSSCLCLRPFHLH
ncbi:hypothetical protein D3C80_2133670 [compost metagenome]